jgi:integrase
MRWYRLTFAIPTAKSSIPTRKKVRDSRSGLYHSNNVAAKPGSSMGPRGATPRRTNFNQYWPRALARAGINVDPDVGLHFHDLRHVGNDLRSPGASMLAAAPPAAVHPSLHSKELFNSNSLGWLSEAQPTRRQPGDGAVGSA